MIRNRRYEYGDCYWSELDEGAFKKTSGEDIMTEPNGSV